MNMKYRIAFCWNTKNLLLAMFIVCSILQINYKNRRYSSHTSECETGETQGPVPVIRTAITSKKFIFDDMLDINHYSPVPGAGERGTPVYLPKLQKDSSFARKLRAANSFNAFVSDMISINRSLPDMRNDRCKCLSKFINVTSLPVVSVIIIFHNELWSSLMRTVKSVLLRSPDILLKEIILVDDGSTRKYLAEELDVAISTLEKVRILRSKVWSGVVSARLKGARAAKGEVIAFLDSHCEVTVGWLEPLVERAVNEDVYICPHIDNLCPDTLSYQKTVDFSIGGFNWNLYFRWIYTNSPTYTELENLPSYKSPVMSGGLFAVRKNLFWRLGGYDEGMKFWGAENLELSWRAWQCGASVEITPCSRVGHIYRENKSPFKYPEGVRQQHLLNLARAAAVWMDDWANFFFKFNPSLKKVKEDENLRHRIELRKNLSCKSFQWYLENVWPKNYLPSTDKWFGKIRNARGSCLGINDLLLEGSALGIRCTSSLELNTLLIFTREGKIIANEGLCLHVGIGQIIWRRCIETHRQVWKLDESQIKDAHKSCLTLLATDNNTGIGDPLKMRKCIIGNRAQTWHFEKVSW